MKQGLEGTECLLLEEIDFDVTEAMHEHALEMLAGCFSQGVMKLGSSKPWTSLYKTQYAVAITPYSWKVC